jgi:hypothetical protein
LVIKFKNFPQISRDSTVKNATLSLYTYSVNSGTNTLKNGPKSLYLNTEDWNESTVNWSNKPDYASSTIATSNTSSTRVWEEFDVTEEIKDIIENGADNYGFTLRHTSYNYGVRMRSSDYTSDPTLTPKLEIEYDPVVSVKPNKFKINPASIYNVKIVNIQGRQIASFETKNLDIDKVKKSLSSGVHIIHITTPNQKFSQKIRVVR